jgi:hypothetical protein
MKTMFWILITLLLIGSAGGFLSIDNKLKGINAGLMARLDSLESWKARIDSGQVPCYIDTSYGEVDTIANFARMKIKALQDRLTLKRKKWGKE